MSAVDTEVTYGLPTDPEDANPPNTYTEPATEDPIFVANQTFEGLAAIPEDPTTKTLAVYFTDIVPVPFNELEGTNDVFIPTDSDGTYTPPAISFTSASSTNFPFEGGVTTIITGVALDQVSHVRIQNYNCTYNVNSSTQLTVTIPICPDNDHTTTKTIDCYDVYNALAFSIPITYNPQVQVYSITSIDVSSGSTLGNTVVTITGGAFFFISRVIFDGTDVFQFEIINSTTILCTTAFKKDAYTGIPGSVQVVDYTGAIVTLPNAFTYVFPTPFILGLSSNNGSTNGGQTIVVAGAYFLNVTNVTLGGVGVTYNVDSETQITFTTNAGTYTGVSLDLTITTLYGASTYSSAFTYNSPPGIDYPTITSVSLNAGNVIGGTTFDIFGTFLDNVTGVTIGTFPVLSYLLVTPSRITCVSGAGVYTGNSLDLILNSPFGNVTRTNVWTYTYNPPTITSVNVSTTSVVGGDTVILTGTNFYLVSNVVICGLQAASYVVNSPTQITLVTPIAYNAADTLGNIQVVATFGTAALYNSFTFFGVQTPIVSNVSPTSGSTAGGTALTINGTNFLTTTNVTVDGNAASFVIDSNIQLTVTTPAALVYTGFPVNIVVTNTFGSYTVPNSFTYTQPTPIISSVTPTTGAVAGGNSIIIAGNYFFGATSVTIDGVSASYVVNSTLQITATTPSSIYTNLPVDIVVTTPAGVGSLLNCFTYLPSPTISSVSPNTGALAGGTTIILTGNSFTNASSVTLNGTPMTSYTVNSASQITAVTPAGISVNTPYSIAIVTPQGNFTFTACFTYLSAPTFTSISPTTGATAGGNSVVIVGTNFNNATNVLIGVTNVTSFTVDSSTQITAVTPSGSVGSKTVTIQTPQGNVTSGSVFSYLNAPTFLFVTPTSGNVTGGDSITISGSDFTNATAVKIGTTNVTSYVVVNSTTITAVTPAGTYGSNETITIETPQGNVTSALPEFTYYNTPTISSVSPASGSYLGNDIVIITGTDFTNTTNVLFGATIVSYNIDSNTQITVITPSGTYGNVETITIQTPHGNITSGAIYSFLDTPTISGVSPTSGTPLGGTSIVITGTDFLNATAVKINTTNVTSYVVNSNTQITAVTPAGTGSNLTITVETPQGNVTSGSLFTYASGPTITSTSPNTGATTGGTTIIITGTNFTGVTAVKIGTTAVASYTVDSITQITAVTSAGTANSNETITVETSSGNGTSSGNLFTFLNTPTFTSISPTSGNIAGGTSITIVGTNFNNATAVKIGSTNVTSYTVNSATQITATTAVGSSAGTAQTVTIETPQGNVTSGTSVFTYRNTPTVTSVSPTSGTTSGGTSITITGTDFQNVSAVKIGTTAVTSFTVVSDTSITATTASGSAGSAQTITVETSHGNGTSATGLFTYTTPPSITLVSPTSGFTTGGTVLTIIGTGFSAGNTVTIGGSAATSVTVVSSTKITCNTPTGTTGAARDVVIDGTVTSAGAFTYLTPAFNKSRYRTFTSQTVPAGTATYFHDVTYSSTLSLFAAVAQFSTGTDGIITSPNGTTWTRRTSPFSEGNNSYLRVVANSTRFLTSGNNPNQNATSTNGTTWTNITGIQGIHSLAYSDTLNVWVVPQGNKIWYSTNDTVSWSSTVVTLDPLACIWAGAPFNKFYIFPRQNGNILYSSNGSTWTTITPGLNTALLYYAAAYSSDLSKILLIANSGTVYESTNGTTWTYIGDCVLLGQMRSLIWNGNLQCWFLSGSTGVAVSANGIRWSRIATYSTDTNPDFTSKGIAYSPSLDIFVTAQASMYKSDGALKGSILFGNNNYLTCVNSADFQFGTGDFTIEWYQYQTTISGTQRVFSYGTQIAAQITSAGALEVILNNVTVYTQSLTNYYESQWRHIAIARQGTSLRVFYDGTQLGTTVTNSTNVANASTVFCIGNASTPASGSSFLGKMSNFHVVKGSALYTTNFSKPTEDIIAETTNAYTKLLLPCPSTNFILDYSATPKIVTNVGCTADSSSPYF